MERASEAEIVKEPRQEHRPMQDVIYIGMTILFFAGAIAYTHFCDRVK